MREREIERQRERERERERERQRQRQRERERESKKETRTSQGLVMHALYPSLAPTLVFFVWEKSDATTSVIRYSDA